MGNERNTDKLAGYLIKLGGLTIVLALCWYFKNVLIYIIAAFVVSLIGRPVMRLLRKIKIKGKSAPEWLLAILTIIIIIALLIEFYLAAMSLQVMYALLAALVGIVGAVGVMKYGKAISDFFSSLGDKTTEVTPKSK